MFVKLTNCPGSAAFLQGAVSCHHHRLHLQMRSRRRYPSVAGSLRRCLAVVEDRVARSSRRPGSITGHSLQPRAAAEEPTKGCPRCCRATLPMTNTLCQYSSLGSQLPRRLETVWMTADADAWRRVERRGKWRAAQLGRSLMRDLRTEYLQVGPGNAVRDGTRYPIP